MGPVSAVGQVEGFAEEPYLKRGWGGVCEAFGEGGGAGVVEDCNCGREGECGCADGDAA